jgi:hypothetical protein
MDAAVTVRIDKLKDDVRRERAAIADLSSKTGIGDLKVDVRNASHKLDDVEQLFLDPKILQERRDAHQWNYWLGNAETALGIAVAARQNVEALLTKFGKGARRL